MVTARHSILKLHTKWPTSIAKIFGYFPFITVGEQLRFKFLSLPTISTILQSMMYILGAYWIGKNSKTLFGYASTKLKASPLETISYFTAPMIQASCTVALFIVSMVNSSDVVTIYNRIVSLYEELTAILNWLKAEPSALRTFAEEANKNYRRLLESIFVIIIIMGALSVVQSFEFMKETRGVSVAVLNTSGLFIWVCIKNGYLIIGFVIMSLVNALEVLYNVMSLTLSKRNSFWDSELSFSSTSTDHAVTLKKFVKLSGDICKTVQMINKKLKFHFIFHAVALLARILFNVFICVMNWERDRFSPIAWGKVMDLVLLSIVLYTMCSGGSSLSFAAQQFGKELGDGVSKMAKSEIFFKVQSESLRLLTAPPVVSPGDYFTFNNRLVSSIITILATYSIVLLQFEHEGRVTKSLST